MTDNENNHKNADDVFPLSENIPRLRKYKAKDDMDNGNEIPTSNGHLKIPSVGANRASTLSETTLKMKYEAESPDEMALVKACCSYGCRLVRRSPDTVTVWLPGQYPTLTMLTYRRLGAKGSYLTLVRVADSIL